MVQKVYGDLEVQTYLKANRVNSALKQETITGSITIDSLTSEYWRRIKNSEGSNQEINMPSGGSIIIGWSVVIENDSTSDATITAYLAGPGSIQVIQIGEAYLFTATAASADSATFGWHIVPLLDLGLGRLAGRYSSQFLSNEWTGPGVDGYMELLIEEADHEKGLYPRIVVYESDGGGPPSFIAVNYQTVISDNGDITLKTITPTTNVSLYTVM